MESRKMVSKKAGGRSKVNLTGQKFGRLTALFPTEKRNSNGSVCWLCRCDCGQEVEVPAEGLMYGNNKSCGCLKEQMRKNMNDQFHRIDKTCVEWLEKRKGRSDNTSGCKGVSLLKSGRYRVSIGFQGKNYHLGSYRDLDEAVAVRKCAEEQIHHRFIKSYYAWKERADTDPEWAAKNPLHFRVERKGDGAFEVISDFLENM